MAMSLNRAQIIGNLTKDPEIKQIPGGQMVASFGVATNFSWTDQSGQRQEKAEFHNIVAWRKLAEICGQYLKRGSKVFVEGRLQTRNWEGEDGIKRYRTEIIADQLIMLDRKGDMTSTAVDSENMEREQGGLDNAPVDDAVAANGKQKEDEVSIDDLPF